MVRTKVVFRFGVWLHGFPQFPLGNSREEEEGRQMHPFGPLASNLKENKKNRYFDGTYLIGSILSIDIGV